MYNDVKNAKNEKYVRTARNLLIILRKFYCSLHIETIAFIFSIRCVNSSSLALVDDKSVQFEKKNIPS